MSAKSGAASFRAHSATSCSGDRGTWVSDVALVLALRPSHIVSTPDRPPMDVIARRAFGHRPDITRPGPSSETAVIAAHPSAHAEIQPPARPNHPRSRSSTTRLASAAYSVIAIRKLASTAGTPQTTYRGTEAATVHAGCIACDT